MKRVRLIIGGRVQGVGFRYFVKENACRLHINGYVKNMPGGNVEVDAEGETENLESFIEKCRIGPPQSEVSSFQVYDVAVYGYTRFRIRHCSDF
ncbi:acylphosphatase [Marinilabilia sp.]|uniref:acylphosphatase n=1 Tax=Marinilabilia sp. TaxID=2021252 RepID=UPI0025B86962|nr:acylphosphatase [Marinilabilia sp.]